MCIKQLRICRIEKNKIKNKLKEIIKYLEEIEEENDEIFRLTSSKTIIDLTINIKASIDSIKTIIKKE